MAEGERATDGPIVREPGPTTIIEAAAAETGAFRGERARLSLTSVSDSGGRLPAVVVALYGAGVRLGRSGLTERAPAREGPAAANEETAGGCVAVVAGEGEGDEIEGRRCCCCCFSPVQSEYSETMRPISSEWLVDRWPQPSLSPTDVPADAAAAAAVESVAAVSAVVPA